MSNRNQGEIPWHRKPKVSLAMTINQGLGGPKVKPKGVTDGQSVNIPTLQHFFEEWRSLVIRASYWILVVCLRIFKSRQNVLLRQNKFGWAGYLEKLVELKMLDPYRKPTQVGECKCTKVNGWNLVKELGKQAGVRSQYALPQ